MDVKGKVIELVTDGLPGPVKVAYQIWDDWRINRILKKAEAAGISLSDLEKSHHKIAFLMRVQRAVEVCSNQEVVDYLALAMIGAIDIGDVDGSPDLAQMAVSALSGVTKTELDLLLLMREHELWGTTREEANDGSGFDAFFSDVEARLGLNDLTASAILNGLTRTGLVTPQASGVGNTVTIQGNKLTQLARELYRYVDHAKRLTT